MLCPFRFVFLARSDKVLFQAVLGLTTTELSLTTRMTYKISDDDESFTRYVFSTTVRIRLLFSLFRSFEIFETLAENVRISLKHLYYLNSVLTLVFYRTANNRNAKNVSTRNVVSSNDHRECAIDILLFTR